MKNIIQTSKRAYEFCRPINRLTLLQMKELKELLLIRLHRYSRKQTKPRSKKTPLIIFDIDGTILDNISRQQIIFERELIPKFPTLNNFKKTILTQCASQKTYSILSIIQPFIESNEMFSQIKTSFLTSFLSSAYLQEDKIYPGIYEFFQFLNEQHLHILLLSGRNELFMSEGTIKSLKFINQAYSSMKVQYRLKNDLKIEDISFKLHELSQLKKFSNYEIIAFFDNESEMCSKAQKIFPNSLIIHFNSPQSNQKIFHGFQLNSWE